MVTKAADRVVGLFFYLEKKREKRMSNQKFLSYCKQHWYWLTQNKIGPTLMRDCQDFFWRSHKNSGCCISWWLIYTLLKSSLAKTFWLLLVYIHFKMVSSHSCQTGSYSLKLHDAAVLVEPGDDGHVDKWLRLCGGRVKTWRGSA